VPQTNLTPGCFDSEDIPTYSRIPDGQDRHAFRMLCKQTLEGYREANHDGRSSRVHAFLDLVKRHCRLLKGSASSRVRARHRARQLAGQVLRQTHVVVPDSTREDTADTRSVAAARRHAGSGHIGNDVTTLPR
jgi:hypothetical protein